ncbi:HAD family phosphatase [Variovorax sp. J22P271]|uniref:HAD family hydrolase n=1 Tax=Variovorax davisae TaxID=3053515 RepID=UPI002574A2D1|nr:HAD family phosphatase [Variovorax sp. J22P271]MDM0032154.1 HAD family phosphatase [Variovorax sp. J22P271]
MNPVRNGTTLPHGQLPVMSAKPCAVVFDMDGLLINTEILARQALRLAGPEVGLALSDSVCSLMIGVPLDGCRALLIERYGADVPADALFEGAARHLQAQIDAGAMQMQPGAAALLAQLDAAGTPRAVATSSSRSKAQHHLLSAGLAHWFSTVVTRDDVAQGKPWPDLYLLAARRLGCPPTRCLALEDSYNGVRAASAAAMPVIMVPDLLPPTPEMRARCLAVLPDLHAVARLLA